MKSKSTQTSTNSFAYQTPPTTPQQQAFDTYAQTAFERPDPSIGYTYGNMRENVANRFANPYGANYSPEVADSIRYNQLNTINQAQGQAYREDAHSRRAAKAGVLATSAGLHAPQLTQTGGHQVGTQVGAIGPAIIGAVGSIGAAAMG
jgi:hypothetical protein